LKTKGTKKNSSTSASSKPKRSKKGQATAKRSGSASGKA
jgi:hypothetical protein